jgi:hypothetical protein
LIVSSNFQQRWGLNQWDYFVRVLHQWA